MKPSRPHFRCRAIPPACFFDRSAAFPEIAQHPFGMVRDVSLLVPQLRLEPTTCAFPPAFMISDTRHQFNSPLNIDGVFYLPVLFQPICFPSWKGSYTRSQQSRHKPAFWGRIYSKSQFDSSPIPPRGLNSKLVLKQKSPNYWLLGTPYMPRTPILSLNLSLLGRRLSLQKRLPHPFPL